MISAPDLSAQELSALLHFYADAGVEWLLEDEPVDRIAAFAAAQAERRIAQPQRQAEQSPQAAGSTRQSTSRTAPAPRPAASTGTAVVPDAEAAAAARQAAEGAATLEELKGVLQAFTGCNLKNGARSTVFASGNATSGVMVIGSLPSAEDDRDGTPFSGRQGQLLDKMLAAIGLSRDNTLLTNAVPWRPPGNRTPSPAEIDICRPFIERQIVLAQPKLLLLLGNFAARFFMGEDGTIFSLRGEWREVVIGGNSLPALASFHPQDLLTAPANKPLAWRDLLLFRQRLPI
ncbi:uracil-DNA glycosylase [Rhizobium oryzicola]|uniref:Type-4 uracil-DNA glycosylase n=1 Tax=Rhizobium oryzicola TaxID=1232668 RepID=A0ABT8ST41_9HYPH|nr:uracil-DNA glycosylase [Rhizobium oryzicola]MDO1581590.1 uracil-DNA glycosylase [Rhizobium oryzicola]